jgi:hypothetical protein
MVDLIRLHDDQTPMTSATSRKRLWPRVGSYCRLPTNLSSARRKVRFHTFRHKAHVASRNHKFLAQGPYPRFRKYAALALAKKNDETCGVVGRRRNIRTRLRMPRGPPADVRISGGEVSRAAAIRLCRAEARHAQEPPAQDTLEGAGLRALSAPRSNFTAHNNDPRPTGPRQKIFADLKRSRQRAPVDEA